jgi:hypothetical protein
MSDFDYEYSIGKLQELFPSLRGMEWKIVSFEDWIKKPRRQYQTFCSSPSRVCRIFIVLDLWTTKVENGFQLLVDVVMHGDGALFRRLVEDESDEVVRRRAARALRLLACDKAIPLLIMTTSSRNRPLLASLLILDDMLYRMN